MSDIVLSDLRLHFGGWIIAPTGMAAAMTLWSRFRKMEVRRISSQTDLSREAHGLRVASGPMGDKPIK
jgi:hypothetical protein